jgi:beta-glucosidase
MKKLAIILSFIIIAGLQYSCNQTKDPSSGLKMDVFVDDLIKKMTLDEKIGQLSLFTGDWSTTGPSIRNDYTDLIKQGKAGSVFNAYTVDFVKELQRIAVEDSRLHIPLLFGYDVIHGHRTIFPVPLGQASTWDRKG